MPVSSRWALGSGSWYWRGPHRPSRSPGRPKPPDAGTVHRASAAAFGSADARQQLLDEILVDSIPEHSPVHSPTHQPEPEPTPYRPRRPREEHSRTAPSPSMQASSIQSDGTAGGGMDDLFVLQSRLQEVQRQLVARDRVQAEETAALQTSRADDLRAQREVAVEQASSSELQSLRDRSAAQDRALELKERALAEKDQMLAQFQRALTATRQLDDAAASASAGRTQLERKLAAAQEALEQAENASMRSAAEAAAREASLANSQREGRAETERVERQLRSEVAESKAENEQLRSEIEKLASGRAAAAAAVDAAERELRQQTEDSTRLEEESGANSPAVSLSELSRLKGCAVVFAWPLQRSSIPSCPQQSMPTNWP